MQRGFTPGAGACWCLGPWGDGNTGQGADRVQGDRWGRGIHGVPHGWLGTEEGGWGAGALCQQHSWMPHGPIAEGHCCGPVLYASASCGSGPMDSTGDSRASECSTGSMMQEIPVSFWLQPPGVVSWDVMEVNEGLSPRSLQLCPFPPPTSPAPGVPEGMWAASCRLALL